MRVVWEDRRLLQARAIDTRLSGFCPRWVNSDHGGSEPSQLGIHVVEGDLGSGAKKPFISTIPLLNSSDPSTAVFQAQEKDKGLIVNGKTSPRRGNLVTKVIDKENQDKRRFFAWRVTSSAVFHLSAPATGGGRCSFSGDFSSKFPASSKVLPRVIFFTGDFLEASTQRGFGLGSLRRSWTWFIQGERHWSWVRRRARSCGIHPVTVKFVVVLELPPTPPGSVVLLIARQTSPPFYLFATVKFRQPSAVLLLVLPFATVGFRRPKSENVPAQVTSIRLNKDNYLFWSAALEIGITSRGRLPYITGERPTPSKTDPSWATWVLEDSQVKGDLSVASFYAALKTKWEELDYHVNDDWSCGSDHALYWQKEWMDMTFIFLGGLRDEFESIRSQILNCDETPGIEEVYARVESEEQRRQVMHIDSGHGSSPSAFVSRAPGTEQRPARRCSHCNKLGHFVDFCWDLHPEKRLTRGRPPSGRRGPPVPDSSLEIVRDDSDSHVEGGPGDEQPTARDHLFGQVYTRKKKDVLEDVDPRKILDRVLFHGQEMNKMLRISAGFS
ncbi:hypothetical protein EJ110_NYTH26278 [Nymphaea thermarum]|nr:hypothetical protein EJ110_NYTH26278 [Nymphaea thermarum]